MPYAWYTVLPVWRPSGWVASTSTGKAGPPSLIGSAMVDTNLCDGRHGNPAIGPAGLAHRHDRRLFHDRPRHVFVRSHKGGKGLVAHERAEAVLSLHGLEIHAEALDRHLPEQGQAAGADALAAQAAL